jgi:uncharacterized RDD family membrane protein YckC
MPDEPTKPGGEGPPSYPGSMPPPVPPPGPAPGMPPPPVPPSYPASPPPPPPGSYPVGGYAPPPPPYASYGGGDGPGTVPYAPWGTRLGGYLIDFVIFIPVLLILALLFRHTHVLTVHLNTRRNGTETRRTFSLLSVLLTGLADLVYVTILCGGRRGQTVGMMAVGIRVVRDGTFGLVGYGQAFLRALVEGAFRFVGAVIFFLGVVWLLDMLFPLWDKKRQTLHDKITGTVVLRARNVV